VIACGICGNKEANKIYKTQEMMFGYKDKFNYLECGSCGCLQNIQIPENLESYYPKDEYYSYNLNYSFWKKIKKYFKGRHLRYCLGSNDISGWLVSYFWKESPIANYLNQVPINYKYKILDVGCGAGDILLDLMSAGFQKVTGVDPFISQNIEYKNGLRIFKKHLYEVEDTYDFIILNHSFEHMQQPLEILKEIYRILKPDRFALIRIPLASSYAWRTYGVNWVQLDAPRHIYLHTKGSMKILAEQANFKIEKIVFDSYEFQFWGSEQYCQGITLRSEKSYDVNPGKSVFSAQDIKRFKSKSKELNNIQEGDQACFYLYKP
jgi:SAM-dependent methyltransferase